MFQSTQGDADPGLASRPRLTECRDRFHRKTADVGVHDPAVSLRPMSQDPPNGHVHGSAGAIAEGAIRESLLENRRKGHRNGRLRDAVADCRDRQLTVTAASRLDADSEQRAWTIRTIQKLFAQKPQVFLQPRREVPHGLAVRARAATVPPHALVRARQRGDCGCLCEKVIRLRRFGMATTINTPMRKSGRHDNVAVAKIPGGRHPGTTIR